MWAAARLARRPIDAANSFDALAEAQLLQHFQIEAGALLQPLRLDQMAVIDIAFDALAQLFLIVSMARRTVSRGVT